MILLTKQFDELYQKIIDFNTRNYEKNCLDEYLYYRFKILTNPKFTNNSVFAVQKDEIIGQLLMLPTFIKLGDKEVVCNWGMDYIVIPEHRLGPVGTGILRNATKGVNHLGYGLGRESLKIHNMLGINVISYYNLCIWLSTRGYLRLPTAFRQKRSEKLNTEALKFPDRVNGFQRVYDAKFRKVIYDDIPYIQPYRGEDYIRNRFFYKSNRYFVYVNNDNYQNIYFVIRPVLFKGLNIMLLVDYRYNGEAYREFVGILNSVKSLAKILKMDGVITMSSLKTLSKTLNWMGFIPYKRREIVSNFLNKMDVNKSNGIIITLADSDGEFYFSRNEWSYT